MPTTARYLVTRGEYLHTAATTYERDGGLRTLIDQHKQVCMPLPVRRHNEAKNDK